MSNKGRKESPSSSPSGHSNVDARAAAAHMPEGALSAIQKFEYKRPDIELISQNWSSREKEVLQEEEKFKEDAAVQLKMGGAPIFDSTGKILSVLPDRIDGKPVILQIFGSGRAVRVGQQVLLAVYMPMNDQGAYDLNKAYAEERADDPIVFVPQEYIRGEAPKPRVTLIDLRAED